MLDRELERAHRGRQDEVVLSVDPTLLMRWLIARQPSLAALGEQSSSLGSRLTPTIGDPPSRR